VTSVGVHEKEGAKTDTSPVESTIPPLKPILEFEPS
tara:strand:+ start:185 stop:292 length:108 start_codon:yes stop_codon:yes gene_type:complete